MYRISYETIAKLQTETDETGHSGGPLLSTIDKFRLWAHSVLEEAGREDLIPRLATFLRYNPEENYFFCLWTIYPNEWPTAEEVLAAKRMETCPLKWKMKNA